MQKRQLQRGFTFTEILVVVAVLGIIATFSAVTFVNMNKSSTLRAGTSALYDALSGAREQTLGASQDTVYGVHIASTSVTRFEGTVFSAGNPTNREFVFNGSIRATSTLISSGGGNVIFRRLTGEPSQAGTIFLRNGISTTTIVIHASGLIE
jgi:prepilin-type N-terminal cleavage/methylation domain-containing protein